MRIPAASESAVATLSLVESLQHHFVSQLELLGTPFVPVEWRRDGGRHGGGIRFGVAQTSALNRASVNVSCVHYDDEPAHKVRSATALSTIIHPQHPRLPSVHIHVSFTELREGKGTWRLMADLNPAIEVASQSARFAQALARAAPTLAQTAFAQGDRYFFIPALQRHRGVAHFYVEDFSSGNFEADLELARSVGRAAMDTSLEFWNAMPSDEPTDRERAKQLAYHTLYLFQVLTLDRGTTSGLLVHDQNDVGTMGSLPSWVDRSLLASWEDRLPKPQDELLRAIVDALPRGPVSSVTDEVRAALAKVVRNHYQRHPEALALQASRAVER